MLDLFEKLINEHGSSTILKERLELFSDKYNSLEEKLNSANEINTQLKAENERLNSEIEKLNSKIEPLSESSNQIELDEIKKRILNNIFNSEYGCSLSELSTAIESNKSTVTYHIDILIEKKLISSPCIGFNAPPNYFLSKLGRAYVVEKM